MTNSRLIEEVEMLIRNSKPNYPILTSMWSMVVSRLRTAEKMAKVIKCLVDIPIAGKQALEEWNSGS